MAVTDSLSTTFAALADPTRRAILARLSLGETSVAELSKPFAMSAPAVTKHLKVLQRAGLVRQGRQAQWRPCQLQAAPLREAADWVAQYRQHWEERLDRLEDYLAELQAQPSQPGQPDESAKLETSNPPYIASPASPGTNPGIPTSARTRKR